MEKELKLNSYTPVAQKIEKAQQARFKQEKKQARETLTKISNKQLSAKKIRTQIQEEAKKAKEQHVSDLFFL